MPNNINKVVFGNQTLIDLTSDTITPADLQSGVTAHDRSGTPVTGTAKQGHVIQNKSGTDLTQRGTLQFTDGLNATDDSTNSKTKVGVDTTFTEASTRANINSGDSFSTILGKIKKWFTDIPSLFVSKSGDTMRGRLNIDQQSGNSGLWLGNNIPNGTTGASRGLLLLYGLNQYYGQIFDGNGLTGNRDYYLPDKSGTLATTDDVDAKVSKSGDTMTGELQVNRNGEVGVRVARTNSGTSTVKSTICIGNNIPDGTTGATFGSLTLYGDQNRYAELQARNMTANRTHQLPDESGTIALKENKGAYITSVEATGTSQTSSLSSYIGHMAMIRVRVDDNNYYNLTGVDIIGESSFVTMHGFGGNTSYSEISAVVRFSSSSGHKYNCLRVMRSGTDVTSNAKLIVYVL